MKPSERIVEICRDSTVDLTGVDSNLATCMRMVQGICDYLDEQYEKNKPCEHEPEDTKKLFVLCKKCHVTLINGKYDGHDT